MGLFDFFTHQIAIDLGTANTLIVFNDEVVVDQPSIIARDRNTKKTIAVGDRAMQMFGKTHENIETIRPLKDGVIADFQAAEEMIRELIKMLYTKKSWFSPAYKMVICIPSGITEVEKRAVFNSAERAGGKENYLIYEPMAAALGIGINIDEPVGNMVVDIGGGTTEIAVISLMGIVQNESIKTAGDSFTNDIIDFVRKDYRILIGERTAENIKIQIGSAITDLDDPPEMMQVNGRGIQDGIPKEITLGYSDIAKCLDKSIIKIEDAIMRALETTPPELASDIYKSGIYLTGGGALLRGLDERLSRRTKLKITIPEDPLKAVVRGTGIALRDTKKYPFLITS